MLRPLRIEYPGAVYRVTSLGNARADIFDDDANRKEKRQERRGRGLTG
jgi:putative transposase